MRIHFIAIGGAIMHNLAIALHKQGHIVSGSDDIIYDPAKSNLKKYDLLPKSMGWDANQISSNIDFVILGMHAKADNPELQKANSLGIKTYSFPEFIFEHSKEKNRIAIGGSHGKTTTTTMILHILYQNNISVDYLVGATLKNGDLSVKLSDNKTIILEADEYLSSSLDRTPKFLHYKPHIGVITGIAWDHINVFPTFENYLFQFQKFIENFNKNDILIYYKHDKNIKLLVDKYANCNLIPYSQFEWENIASSSIKFEQSIYQLNIFGDHNLQNLKAAYHVCKSMGLTDKQFFTAATSFGGASKRLQPLIEGEKLSAFIDFAHAPSKVKATVKAVRQKFPNRKFIAIFELHTYSSLNKDFLTEYNGSLDSADEAIVFYNDHAMKIKNMPPLDTKLVQSGFGKKGLHVFHKKQDIIHFINELNKDNMVILFMSSGNFGNLDMNTLF